MLFFFFVNTSKQSLSSIAEVLIEWGCHQELNFWTRLGQGLLPVCTDDIWGTKLGTSADSEFLFFLSSILRFWLAVCASPSTQLLGWHLWAANWLGSFVAHRSELSCPTTVTEQGLRMEMSCWDAGQFCILVSEIRGTSSSVVASSYSSASISRDRGGFIYLLVPTTELAKKFIWVFSIWSYGKTRTFWPTQYTVSIQ